MGDAPSLLPAGLEDQLPPWAEAEAEALSLILGTARSFGYDRVKPPLLEYEDTLTAFAPMPCARALSSLTRRPRAC